MSRLYQTLSLKGRTVLVTGASSGFGEAITRRFAELGTKLIIAARREERLQSLAEELTTTFGVKVHTVVLDVRDTAAIEALPSQLPAEFAQVDILVNNAGLALGLSGPHEHDLEDIRTMIETNVLGLIAMTKAFSKGMVERNKGHIINIGSTAGHEAYAGGGGYNASKFAVQAFTTATRHDLVGTNIRVTLISPGAAETEFSLVRFKGDAEMAKAVYKGLQPLTADDVADNVVYAATRPEHVQIADIIVMPTHQSGAKSIARTMADK